MISDPHQRLLCKEKRAQQHTGMTWHGMTVDERNPAPPRFRKTSIYGDFGSCQVLPGCSDVSPAILHKWRSHRKKWLPTVDSPCEFRDFPGKRTYVAKEHVLQKAYLDPWQVLSGLQKAMEEVHKQEVEPQREKGRLNFPCHMDIQKTIQLYINACCSLTFWGSHPFELPTTWGQIGGKLQCGCLSRRANLIETYLRRNYTNLVGLVGCHEVQAAPDPTCEWSRVRCEMKR